jgi:hypothetical protein
MSGTFLMLHDELFNILAALEQFLSVLNLKGAFGTLLPLLPIHP